MIFITAICKVDPIIDALSRSELISDRATTRERESESRGCSVLSTTKAVKRYDKMNLSGRVATPAQPQEMIKSKSGVTIPARPQEVVTLPVLRYFTSMLKIRVAPSGKLSIAKRREPIGTDDNGTVYHVINTPQGTDIQEILTRLKNTPLSQDSFTIDYHQLKP